MKTTRLTRFASSVSCHVVSAIVRLPLVASTTLAGASAGVSHFCLAITGTTATPAPHALLTCVLWHCHHVNIIRFVVVSQGRSRWIPDDVIGTARSVPSTQQLATVAVQSRSLPAAPRSRPRLPPPCSRPHVARKQGRPVRPPPSAQVSVVTLSYISSS